MAVDEIFVGREAELAFLRDRLGEALAGMCRTVLLEGAAGVGKEALVDGVIAQVGGRGVLRASGEELEAGLAYGVVDQLLAELGRPAPELLAGLGAGRDADVEPLRMGGALVEMFGGLHADGQILV